MKAKERHELKSNELVEWLENLPQWAKENTKSIIYTSAAVILLILAVFVHWYYKDVEVVQKQVDFTNLFTEQNRTKIQTLQSQAEGKDISFGLLQVAETLGETGQNERNKDMAALALIKQGETLRTELQFRQSAASEQDFAAQINKAKTAYTQAAEKAKSATLKAMARFGIAICEEELGSFDAAEKGYRDITAEPEFAGTAPVALAADRLTSLSDYKQKVAFKEEAPPAAASQPMLDMMPQPSSTVDVNQLGK